MEKLKILNLSHSKYLTKTPDFSNLPNLEELILKDCPNLSEVHQSIGDLCNLLVMNFKDCTSLKNIPRKIYKLKSVKTFILSGCSKIEKLEEDIVQMESLTTLIADHTAIKYVPFSIVRSKSIVYISLCGHEGLACNVFPSLMMSWISQTRNPLSCTQPFQNVSSSLVSVNVQDKNLIDLSTMLSGFSKVHGVLVQCCSHSQLTQELRRILDELCDVSFTKLERTLNASQVLENCMGCYLIGMGSYQQVIHMLNKSITEGLARNSYSDCFLPAENYPYWLAYTGEGHSVLFQVPEGSDCHIKGMALCVVYSSTHKIVPSECITSVLIINHTSFTIHIYKRDTSISFNDEDWLDLMSNLRPGETVEIFAIFGHGLTIKRIWSQRKCLGTC
ncbi:PREDICTED: disease resistance-like protein CSA1 [Lupinus angustifolius]|uniref:disease resistance-like protein CSA1 n=1 Tax=Lupinus angustifolius TaxID=3871 RepID=UPI00092F3742|nr:PREDICTED: disease resistance-like protein CSA1 [Lupinus angustifolius]